MDNQSDGPEAPADGAERVRERVDRAVARAGVVAGTLGERTLNVAPGLDEDAFFTTAGGAPTLVSRADLERAVPPDQKPHLSEVERYWVNKPYAFAAVFRSEKDSEHKYYLVEPHLTTPESDLLELLSRKLSDAITYSREARERGDSVAARAQVIEEEVLDLLERYDLRESPGSGGRFRSAVGRVFGRDGGGTDPLERDTTDAPGLHPGAEAVEAGDSTRPRGASPGSIESLSPEQVETLLYYLKRDFVGYGRIDGIKHDINVEDISCDGYETPVFVYHSDYEQLISNVRFDPDTLDDFVVKLAQRSGKGISKRQPQVDATLPDGSRAQLTLGEEVSDHGTNFTIRQFKDVPFTPVDLINWHTFSLDEMAFLWLCIENNRSLLFAGGTASGKTTSLNAVSLFIPSKAKIVSIEDTREVELPQRNWIASVTRPSFNDDGESGIDEFDLLEAALRQRPEYIVMGEIRGEEGRTLFQVMSTGHTTYTTFHADSVGEVLKRFTTDPINVSKTMFTALDLVSIQTQTRVRGRKVRRNTSLTEINHYDPENDEINVGDVYEWDAESDAFDRVGRSNTLESVRFDRGWDEERLERELFERRVVLAHLVDRGLNTYAEVAATIQGYMHDPDTILGLVANDRLAESLSDLRDMETVLIDIEEAKEAMVPRPEPSADGRERAEAVLDRAAEELFGEYETTGETRSYPSLASFDWNTEGGASALSSPAPEEATAAPDAGSEPAGAAVAGGETSDGADDEGRESITPQDAGEPGIGGAFGPGGEGIPSAPANLTLPNFADDSTPEDDEVDPERRRDGPLDWSAEQGEGD